jgi:hypothetical protein
LIFFDTKPHHPDPFSWESHTAQAHFAFGTISAQTEYIHCITRTKITIPTRSILNLKSNRTR